MHAYTKTGEACYFVENKSKGGLRPTTIRDVRALDLLPSPTEIIKQLAKPALLNWIVRQSVLAVVTSPDKELESLDDKITRILDEEKQQNDEVNAAMDLGTRIHEAIELTIGGKGGGDFNLYGYVVPVIEELQKIGQVIGSEQIVVGEGYAGKLDCKCQDTGKIVVVDFKTTRNIPKQPYDEHLLQIAAYCGAIGATGDDRIEGAIIYISTSNPGELKVCSVADWTGDYRRFRLLLEFWKLTNSMP